MLPATEGARNPEIHQTLREWLEGSLLPPMHFLVEPEVLSGIVDDRLLFVARREGRIVAFLVASPVAARNGYLVEELARSPRAPNGTSELLIDAAMHRFAADGCTWATMGLVALARGTVGENPLWLRSLMVVARAHANRFYNFRGLETFSDQNATGLLGADLRDLERTAFLAARFVCDGRSIFRHLAAARDRPRRVERSARRAPPGAFNR